METDFDHIITEIGAGKCLFVKTEGDLIHNSACDRAIRIVRQYRDGEGLFQRPDSSSNDDCADCADFRPK